MSVTVRNDSMTSDRSAHTARRTPGEEQLWEVSWLPGRYLGRNQAVTAMVIADAGSPAETPPGHRTRVHLPSGRSGQSFTVEAEMHPGHRARAHVEQWAASLGLTASQVLAKVASPPSWAITEDRTAAPTDPEAAE